MPITRNLPFMLKFFAFLHSKFVLPGLGLRFFVGLVFGVVEFLERVLGEAFVFTGVG